MLALGIMLAVLLGGLSGCAANSGQRISASTLLQQVRNGQKPYIVDVREREELQGPLGALADIKNIPLSEWDQRYNEIPKDRPVVLICQSGHRSSKAMAFLKNHGYTQIQDVEGGMIAVRGEER
jgi:rhodanese-related sulfurtransferase